MMKISFREFLKESKQDKNLHLEHIEDMGLENGVNGFRQSINFLRALRDMLAGDTETPVLLSTKFDGAPAIFCGINPDNGKFFVGTKGVFAKSPKLNYTDEDITKNHPGPGLAAKLKIALEYLPQLNITNILQGDVLFTHNDLIKEKIHGNQYLTFRPNTITYTVLINSELAHRISAAKLGIVFHTSYHGKTMTDMKASFNVNIGLLKQTKDVWFRDATFIDASGTATFTEEETNKITNLLSQAGNIFSNLSQNVINRIAENETFKIMIKTFNNMKVREGREIQDTKKHTLDLINYVTEKANQNIIDAKKPETKRKRELEKKEILAFFKPSFGQLKLVFDLQNILVEAKLMIIRKLEKVQSIGTFYKDANGYRVANPEGFVVSDHFGKKAVKLVDRLSFSHENFNAAKEWK